MPPATVGGKKAEREGELERVYRTLREWLIAARLRPGRIPFRGGFGGTVPDQPNAGPGSLRAPGPRQMANSESRAKGISVAPISVRDIVELYEFRRILECFSAEKVALSARREQIARTARFGARRKQSECGAREDPLRQPGISSAAWPSLPETSGWWTNCASRSDMSSAWIHCVRRRFPAGSRIPIFCRPSNPTAHRAHQAMAIHIDTSRDKMIKLFGS